MSVMFPNRSEDGCRQESGVSSSLMCSLRAGGLLAVVVDLIVSGKRRMHDMWTSQRVQVHWCKGDWGAVGLLY